MEVQPIINEELTFSDIPVLYHELETNGIGYINFLFSVANVPQELIPYIGILKSVLGLIDTENYEYSELSNEINLNTGGIGITIENYPNVSDAEGKEFKGYVSVKGKALYEKLPVDLPWFVEKAKAEENPWGCVYGALKPGQLRHQLLLWLYLHLLFSESDRRRYYSYGKDCPRRRKGGRQGKPCPPVRRRPAPFHTAQ